jgi:uncharacterized membrane protein YtjA (UPF0391 family)
MTIASVWHVSREAKASPRTDRTSFQEITMLRWAVVFAVIAIVAGLLGFTGVAAGAATIAKALFFIFLVLFLVAIIAGSSLFRRP